jgi:hypothetical protein
MARRTWAAPTPWSLITSDSLMTMQ